MTEQELIYYTEKLSWKQLQKMNIKSFTKYAHDRIKQHLPRRNVGLALKFPYQLNCSPNEKFHDCHALFNFTAFLNNAGNLCHIVSAEDFDLIIRIKFRNSIKHLSRKKQLIAIWMRVHRMIDVGLCPK